MSGRDFTALNNHLFAQLEKVGNEDLTGDELKDEIARSKAITDISKAIIDGARTQLQAERLYNDGDIHNKPKMLE